MPELEQSGRNRLFDLGVDCSHDLEPLIVLELADRFFFESHRQPQAHRLRVHEHAVWDERGVKPSQSVDHALRLEASERPTAQRDVEALALDVERLGAVYAEANILDIGRRARDFNALGIRVERVDACSAFGCEKRQPTFTASDIEDSDSLEGDERLDSLRFGVGQIRDMHA
jgi:hypothetical protein